jgi:hypothetical protein
VAPATGQNQLIATGPSRQTAGGPVQQAADKPIQQTATRPAKQDDITLSEAKHLQEKKPTSEKKPTGEKKSQKKTLEDPTGQASPGHQDQARPNKQKASKHTELSNHVTADEKQLKQQTDAVLAQPAENTSQGTGSVFLSPSKSALLKFTVNTYWVHKFFLHL